MKNISLSELLEAGCHFGHHVERWNPKARAYIYGEKNGVHIINLEKTKEGLEKAAEYLRDLSAKGGNVIFVATKKQAKSLMREIAEKYGLMYFTLRWPGGFLTNFDIVSKNFAKMQKFDEMLAAEVKTNTKKELLMASKSLAKLTRIYGTVRHLKGLPDALVIVDIKKEEKVVFEAIKTGVKTVGLVDTNCDPTPIDLTIPTNDDAAGALRLVLEYLGEAVAEGKAIAQKADIAK
jgi:small subunit ribosomal protein S2